MGCAMGTVKFLVFLFNFLVSLVGLTLIIIGTIFFIQIRDLTSGMNDTFLRFPPIFILVLGCVVFCIAFLGCCGAMQKSSCMLLLYAIILLALFCTQIGLGVYSFLSVQNQDDNKFNETIEADLTKLFDSYQNNNVSRAYVNNLQLSLECCGVKNKNYWINIPYSCCEDGEEQKQCKSKDAFNIGCAPRLSEFFMDSASVLGYIAIGLCAIELVASIFALCLRSSISNEERRSHY